MGLDRVIPELFAEKEWDYVDEKIRAGVGQTLKIGTSSFHKVGHINECFELRVESVILCIVTSFFLYGRPAFCSRFAIASSSQSHSPIFGQ